MRLIFGQLLLLPTLVSGASLELRGANSEVVFNQARLSATCPSESSPSIRFIKDREQLGIPPVTSSSTLHVALRNVPFTCIDVNVETPCAADDLAYPPLFSCEWQGKAASKTTGPVVALREVDALTNGEVLGVKTYLLCPALGQADWMEATGHALGTTTEHKLNLTASHWGYGAIPFKGAPGGETITYTVFAPPSTPPFAPPTPPLPPLSPPPSPPLTFKTLISETSSFSYYGHTTMSEFNAEWKPDKWIKIEWGTNSMTFKSPTCNPFVDRPAVGESTVTKTLFDGFTLNSYDSVICEITDFSTTETTLQGWVDADTPTASPGRGAVWCTGNQGWDTAWAVKPRKDNNYALGCCSGGWTGRGAFYGDGVSTGRTGGWVGVRDNSESKANGGQMKLLIQDSPGFAWDGLWRDTTNSFYNGAILEFDSTRAAVGTTYNGAAGQEPWGDVASTPFEMAYIGISSTGPSSESNWASGSPWGDASYQLYHASPSRVVHIERRSSGTQNYLHCMDVHDASSGSITVKTSVTDASTQATAAWLASQCTTASFSVQWTLTRQ